MSEALGATLMLLGSAFMLLAAVGLLRMPDIFTRMSASSKASTLGAACVLAGAALVHADGAVAARAAAAIAFLFLTVPLAAHVIGRAAYRSGVPLWKGTVADELGRPAGTRPADRAGEGGAPPDVPA